MIGDGLRLRMHGRQATEVAIADRALNRMFDFGRLKHDLSAALLKAVAPGDLMLSVSTEPSVIGIVGRCGHPHSFPRPPLMQTQLRAPGLNRSSAKTGVETLRSSSWTW